MNYTLICDGAYSSTRDQGGIGIIFLRNNKKILEYSKMFKETTNNQMEIIAIIIGLKCVKKHIDSLTIISDSEYCIGCASKGWKRKKNIKLWEKFDQEFERVSSLCPNIIFKHVKGHSGDKWNELADKLAVEASKRVEL